MNCASDIQFKARVIGTNAPISITETAIDGTQFIATSVKVDIYRVTDNTQVVTQATAAIDNQNPNASHTYKYTWDTTGYQAGAYNTVWTRTASDGTVILFKIAAPVTEPVGRQ